MSTVERTRRPPGSATTISRRRFLKQTAFATAVASVPYLAGRGAAFGEERAKGADAALDRALKDLVAMEGGPPGVIAVVQRGRQRKVHTFGVRNTKSGLPMRVDDRMRIASVAKAFSGAVALSLVSEGVLSSNDTIGELLKDLPEPPPEAWAKVTLRQLLDHTSGLPDILEDRDFLDAFLASLDKTPPPEKLLTYAYDQDPPLRFDPGSEYQYSNSDNIAVALMVEAATGTSYEDQLGERVYKPLGLRETSLPRGPNLSKPFIHGYDPSQDPPDDISELAAAGWAWASGGIVSTPADLNAFIRGYVGGKLFDERTRTKQRRVIEGGSSEPPGPGKELCRARYLPLRDEVRDGVGPHRELLRLHPVCRRQRRREPFGDGLHQRTTHPDDRQSGGLRGAEACGGEGRVRRAVRLTIRRFAGVSTICE